VWLSVSTSEEIKFGRATWRPRQTKLLSELLPANGAPQLTEPREVGVEGISCAGFAISPSTADDARLERVGNGIDPNDMIDASGIIRRVGRLGSVLLIGELDDYFSRVPGPGAVRRVGFAVRRWHQWLP
jgi:hypothetical protein